MTAYRCLACGKAFRAEFEPMHCPSCDARGTCAEAELTENVLAAHERAPGMR